MHKERLLTLSPGEPGGPSLPETPCGEMRNTDAVTDRNRRSGADSVSEFTHQRQLMSCPFWLIGKSADLFSWFPRGSFRPSATSRSLSQKTQTTAEDKGFYFQGFVRFLGQQIQR